MPKTSSDTSTDAVITVNLIFLGTDYHRNDKKKMLLTELASAIQDDSENFTEPRSFVRLFDGVGSTSFQPDPDNPTPGQYTYDPLSGKKRLRLDFFDPVFGPFIKFCQRVLGMVTGHGVEDILLEAILYISQLAKNGQLPKRINLYGHSRGADTAIRFAHLVKVIYPNIEINIFAIDDVPGPWRGLIHESKTISENVKDFTSILMTNENTPIFEPQDLGSMIVTNPRYTRVREQIYKGDHSSHQVTSEETSATPKLIHNDLIRFTMRNGVQYKKNLDSGQTVSVPLIKKNETTFSTTFLKLEAKDLSDDERLNLYHEMKQQDVHYSQSLYRIFPHRNFVRRLSDKFRNTDFFINQEHRELFKKKFFAFFDYFFQGNVDKALQAQVIVDIRSMAKQFPKIFSCVQGFIFNDVEKIFNVEKIYNEQKELLAVIPTIATLASAQGKKIREQSPYQYDKPLVYDELSRLTFAVRQLIDYTDRHPPQKHFNEVQTSAKSLQHILRQITESECNTEEKCKNLTLSIAKESSGLQKRGIQHSFVDVLDGILDTPECYANLCFSALDGWLHNQKLNLCEQQKSLITTQKTAIGTIICSDELALSKKIRIIEIINNLMKTIGGENKTLKPEIESLLHLLHRKTTYAGKIHNKLIAFVENQTHQNLIQQILNYFGFGVDTKSQMNKTKAIVFSIGKLHKCILEGNGNNATAISEILTWLKNQIRYSQSSFFSTKTEIEIKIERWLNKIAPLVNIGIVQKVDGKHQNQCQ